jgi:hypothetical protein
MPPHPPQNDVATVPMVRNPCEVKNEERRKKEERRHRLVLIYEITQKKSAQINS